MYVSRKSNRQYISMFWEKPRSGGCSMEKKKEKVETVIHGTFPMQRFLDTLSMIVSNKYNADITAKIVMPDEEQQHQDKEAV